MCGFLTDQRCQYSEASVQEAPVQACFGLNVVPWLFQRPLSATRHVLDLQCFKRDQIITVDDLPANLVKPVSPGLRLSFLRTREATHRCDPDPGTPIPNAAGCIFDSYSIQLSLVLLDKSLTSRTRPDIWDLRPIRKCGEYPETPVNADAASCGGHRFNFAVCLEDGVPAAVLSDDEGATKFRNHASLAQSNEANPWDVDAALTGIKLHRSVAMRELQLVPLAGRLKPRIARVIPNPQSPEKGRHRQIEAM